MMNLLLVMQVGLNKNQFLIDIFNEIVKIDPNTKLVLVGGGELDDALKIK